MDEKKVALISDVYDILPSKPGKNAKRDAEYGLYISRETMANWFDGCYDLYIYDLNQLIQKDFSKQKYVMLDENTHNIVKNKKKRSTCYELVGMSGRNEPKQIALYKFSRDRSCSIVSSMVGDHFQDVIQFDGYQAYHTYGENHEGVSNIGCWARVQVKIKEGLTTDTAYNQIKKLDSKEKQKASLEGNPNLIEFIEIKELIEGMFSIEKTLAKQEADFDEIYKMRQEKSKPIMEAIFRRAEQLKSVFPKKNKKSVALTYLLNQREYLEGIL
ncbi:IS66 family transposase [Ileibacterium valens]|uniref:IS66 family transposase n=1 Tax=Ileibacterium valens TaxID=1862668 RepID=UPI002729CE3C|nr:transposase [Ileibacterium valens]